jgi:sortase B
MEFGDKLLTLSTCYGASETNMRFILVARRLRDGEVAGDLSTIQRTDEYIQKQKEKEKTTKEIS